MVYLLRTRNSHEKGRRFGRYGDVCKLFIKEFNQCVFVGVCVCVFLSLCVCMCIYVAVPHILAETRQHPDKLTHTRLTFQGQA